MTKILAIETSCDETAAAVLEIGKRGNKALSNIIASQIKLHRKTSGVVPEVAARAHLQKINPIVKQALHKASVPLKNIDYIAVTTGPGLVSSLLVGTEYAKALALAFGKKLIPVNHMLGHLYSGFIANAEMKLPSINLIVSGGHTYLVLLKNKKDFKVIGQTVDDAAGEAFDKVAKMLGLKYPGGPEVAKFAARNSATRGKAQRGKSTSKKDFNFPRPMINAKNFDFSFAGLKTAVLYKIKNDKLNIRNARTRADICFSFQNAAVDVLVSKTIKAAKLFKAKNITLSGGVAANKKLRQDLATAAKKAGCKFYVPDFSLCTDNALMIANAAAIMLENGFKPPKAFEKISVNPNLGIR